MTTTYPKFNILRIFLTTKHRKVLCRCLVKLIESAQFGLDIHQC